MIVMSIKEFQCNGEVNSNYMNVKGLPIDFPYDSVNIMPLSIESLEYYPKKVLKDLKKKNGVNMLEIRYTLNKSEMIVSISVIKISLPKRKHFDIAITGDTRCSFFRYSCDDNKWVYINSMWADELK